MKIGILSLVPKINYGGILQSYALQTVLEKMGHEVVVLNKDRRIRVSAYQHVRSFISAILRNYVIRNGLTVKSYWQQEKERKQIEQHTSEFISKHIHDRKLQELGPEALEGLDAVVVGSDQVWRPRYFKKQWGTGIEDAFLNFAKGMTFKRLVYAASFGTDSWEYSEEETKECAELIAKFDAVSVREREAVNLCYEKLKYTRACHVLDPTMLLSRENYEQLVEESGTSKSKGNLLYYILDESDEKRQLIETIAHERALSPFSVKAPTGSVQHPVEQWLRGFMDAEFVVTDSFHACVFSILFGKPFIVVGNKQRGMSRFFSLLDMFSLRDHLITSIKDYRSDCIYSIPDEVYSKLEVYKEQSLYFLKKNLS